MRELTEYEKQKWFEPDRGEIFGFKLDKLDFLMYGDELGEAFATVLRATQMRDYGLSDEFVKAAQVQALDLYYDQLLGFYQEQWEEPSEYGLPDPALPEVQAKWEELGIGQAEDEVWPDYGNVYRDERMMKFWDWCMEWKEENEEATRRILRGEEDGS